MSSRTKRRAADRSGNQALAQLKAAKAAREAGITPIHQYEVQEPEVMYDETGDERLIKRVRQAHDDFIVDDDGQGHTYEDDEDEHDYSDEYSEDERVGK
ncbi:hypothetical protein BGZ65_000525, partial [Modicella reniformis]